MTDPERFSRRSTGLAAELLRAGAAEQPNERGLQQTLLALGFSGVISGAAGAASAAALGSAQLTGAVSSGTATSSAALTTAGTIKAVSATLIIKWIGIGLVGGVGLMGVAAVATRPPPASRAVVSATPTRAPSRGQAAARPARPNALPAVIDSAAPELAASALSLAPRASIIESHAATPELDPGAPLAAEVAYVDHARVLLAAGQASEGLSLLANYEQKFREARLLPEVLFLQLETCERLGQDSEARRAAQRLVAGFPKSPHVARARKLLGQ